MTHGIKVGLIENLKTLRLRDVRAPRPHFNLVSDVEDMGAGSFARPDRQYKFQTKAEFVFEQFAGEGATEHVHKVAVDAIARSIYGDVVDHLRDVLDELYMDGMHDHAATEKLNALVSALRP